MGFHEIFHLKKYEMQVCRIDFHTWGLQHTLLTYNVDNVKDFMWEPNM